MQVLRVDNFQKQSLVVSSGGTEVPVRISHEVAVSRTSLLNSTGGRRLDRHGGSGRDIHPVGEKKQLEEQAVRAVVCARGPTLLIGDAPGNKVFSECH